ncbi:hypothetical protein ACJX0J_039755, partial [Zea mays]
MEHAGSTFSRLMNTTEKPCQPQGTGLANPSQIVTNTTDQAADCRLLFLSGFMPYANFFLLEKNFFYYLFKIKLWLTPDLGNQIIVDVKLIRDKHLTYFSATAFALLAASSWWFLKKTATRNHGFLQLRFDTSWYKTNGLFEGVDQASGVFFLPSASLLLKMTKVAKLRNEELHLLAHKTTDEVASDTTPISE